MNATRGATASTSAARQTAVAPVASAGHDSPQAWIVVAATFLATFTVFGVVYSFGAFFRSMETDFNVGKGATALMFAITTAWYFGLGLFSGRIADRFGPRPVLVAAAVFLGAGLLATSRVTSIWAGYVTYGIGVGTAVACAYVPMVSTVGAWFQRRRTAALGVSVAGIGVGTLVVVPLANRLIDAYGWRTAYVVMGVAGFGLLLVASLGARRPPVAVQQEPPDLRRIVRDRAFQLLYASNLLVTVSLFVPFVFMKPYAEDRGISGGTAATIVGIIGASSVVGRLGLGALGARLSAVRLMQLSFAVLSASFLIWIVADDSVPLLFVYAVVMGVGYGGFIALAPAVAAILFGTRGLGGILGALYTAAGIGGLIGPPLAGALIDGFSYHAAIITAMVIAAMSTAVLFALPSRTPPTPT